MYRHKPANACMQESTIELFPSYMDVIWLQSCMDIQINRLWFGLCVQSHSCRKQTKNSTAKKKTVALSEAGGFSHAG